MTSKKWFEFIDIKTGSEAFFCIEHDSSGPETSSYALIVSMKTNGDIRINLGEKEIREFAFALESAHSGIGRPDICDVPREINYRAIFEKYSTAASISVAREGGDISITAHFKMKFKDGQSDEESILVVIQRSDSVRLMDLLRSRR